MDRHHWLLAAALSAVALAAMATVTARSEPDEPEPPNRPSTSADTPESAALANSSALSGCTDEVTPEGEDDAGLDLDAITAKVERLRELRFSREPDLELLPVDELDRRLAKEVAEDYRPADSLDEERALKLVGAIPRGADLYELRTGGLEGQVAGLYLPETKELLVAEGENPGAFERIALAHELEHALTDERLGIPLPDDADPAVTDPLIASQALVEGSASLLTEFYAVKHIGLGDLLDLGGSADIAQSSQDLARLPYFLQRELLWAYTAGARFACALYKRGGWKAVDRAYADPPAATDQIMFPERYGETPEDPARPACAAGPMGEACELRPRSGRAAVAVRGAGRDPRKRAAGSPRLGIGLGRRRRGPLGRRPPQRPRHLAGRAHRGPGAVRRGGRLVRGHPPRRSPPPAARRREAGRGRNRSGRGPALPGGPGPPWNRARPEPRAPSGQLTRAQLGDRPPYKGHKRQNEPIRRRRAGRGPRSTGGRGSRGRGRGG